MNRLTKVAVLLVALVAVFSFSQENSPVDSILQKERVVVYDTVSVNKIISDLAALETLRNLLINYPDHFYWLIAIVLIGVAVSVFWNRRVIKKLNKRVKKLQKDIERLCKQQQGNSPQKLDSTKSETQLIYKKEPETTQVKSEKEESPKNQSEMEAVEVKR